MTDKKRKPPETEEEVFEVFQELFDTLAPETPEEVNQFLRENGYDPEELARSAESIFEEALKNSPLDWRNRARIGLDAEKEKAAQHQPRLNESRESIVTAIKAFHQKHGTAAHFRKLDLEKLSKDDLANMLADLEYLEAKENEQDE